MSELIRLDDVPDLNEFVPASADLSSEYWTPEDGEVRRLVFWGVERRLAKSQNDKDDTIELDCVIFIQPNGETYSTISNGSKRLVAAFQNNGIERGTPVQVSYLGKKTNRTNGFKSDHWSVVTLKAKG
jgi:hypothetical protein